MTQEQINDFKQKVQAVIDILPEIDRHISSQAVSDAAPALSFLLYDLDKISIDN